MKCVFLNSKFGQSICVRGLKKGVGGSLIEIDLDSILLRVSDLDMLVRECWSLCKDAGAKEGEFCVVGGRIAGAVAWAMKSKGLADRGIYINPIPPFGKCTHEGVHRRQNIGHWLGPVSEWRFQIPGEEPGLTRAFLRFLRTSNWHYWSAISFRPDPESTLIYSSNDSYFKTDDYQRLAERFYGVTTIESRSNNLHKIAEEVLTQTGLNQKPTHKVSHQSQIIAA